MIHRAILGTVLGVLAAAATAAVPENLLLNPDFEFLPFGSSRSGSWVSFRSGSVAGWDQDAYGDAEACRSPRVDVFRPRLDVPNVVVIHAGQRFFQVAWLSELGLDPGDRLSLSVLGFQRTNDVLEARLHHLRVDSAAGTWSPADVGLEDTRRYPRYARGELVRDFTRAARSGPPGDFQLALDDVELVGAFTESRETSTDQPNTIGVMVEFVNVSPDQDVWIYAPCLSRGPSAPGRRPPARPLPSLYRHIPRTMAKLIRGAPLHILIVGASGDRGDANPALCLYDEDPASKTFKQPIAAGRFDGRRIGHPEWDAHMGAWKDYFAFGGRLRLALMRRFNYPIEKILLNYMAASGSVLCEQHFGVPEFAALEAAPYLSGTGPWPGSKPWPPDPDAKPPAAPAAPAAPPRWQDLHPAVFSRPEGPGPDLVIFGSCQLARLHEPPILEGTLRWIQRRYPDAEFLFQIMNNREKDLTGATGMMMELSLHYQIPCLDFGRMFHLLNRHCNSWALTSDGHLQAAGHYLFARLLERAFEATAPIEPGQAQARLPERLYPGSLEWEGEATTYVPPHPRLVGQRACILDDTVANLWAQEAEGIRLDGKPVPKNMRQDSAATKLGAYPRRDARNSTFTTMAPLTRGDRHILELEGSNAVITALDAKTILGRRWIGVESAAWRGLAPAVKPFRSDWGAPYGSNQAVLAAGVGALLYAAGTEFSIAYADQPGGGTLHVRVDGVERLAQPTDAPFAAVSGKPLYIENRRGILGLPYGRHRIEAEAQGGPVSLLGLFAYDTRANRSRERVLRGEAAPGESLSFEPFRAPPLVTVGGGLRVQPENVTPTRVLFSGEGPGTYEIVGE